MITVEYLGVTGRGRTLKEAKADAARVVRGLVASAKAPLIWCGRGHTVIAWQLGEGEAWYTYTTPKEEGMRTFCASATGDAADALRAGRRHLAHNLDDASMADPRDRAEVERENAQSREFNTLYRAHKAAGASDTEAHANACNRIPAPVAAAAPAALGAA